MGQVAMILKRIRSLLGDPPLFMLVLGLAVFGVLIIYSAGQLDVHRPVIARLWQLQIQWLLVSLAGLVVVMSIPVRWYEWLAVPGYVVAICLLVLTLLIGTGPGTKRWIGVGPMVFEPAQFAAVATGLMLARILGNLTEPPQTARFLWKPILIAAAPAALVFLQPDLGTSIVFASLLLATLYWAGTPLSVFFFMLSPVGALVFAFHDWLFAVYMVFLAVALYLIRAYLWQGVVVWAANLAGGIVAVPLWNSLAPYQQSRILVFINPMLDPQGAGWQVIQSRVAMGSGGIIGKGFTAGTQKRLAFLPEQHTDFIYSVVGEEFGFVGAVMVLLAFGLVLWRLVRIAERTEDPFAGIFVFGIFGVWFTHIVVNIGMTIGVMPITGIPLPFLSYGGSFLLASFLAMGMAQRIAAEQGKI